MSGITRADFQRLLATIAEGWNTGDARKAADCFTEDAVYTEPPDRQEYIGRDALYEFFGGSAPPPMSLSWHHTAFDKDRQIGFGEYTFQGNNRYHGVVVIRIRDGKVSNWREYQYRSDLDRDEFVGRNRF